MANGVLVESNVTTQAFSTNCAVIWNNAAGSPARGYLIPSQVALPLVGTVAKSAGPEEQMRLVQVDLNLSKAAARVYDFGAEFQRRLAVDAEYPYTAPALLLPQSNGKNRPSHRKQADSEKDRLFIGSKL